VTCRRFAGGRQTRYDFTADQFDDPKYSHEIEYKDISSSFEEAKTETLPGQIDAMRTAFKIAFYAATSKGDPQ
jgi:hypothetical protein